MKSIIGIAIEQFEYNERWRLAVVFLTFFLFSTISLQLLVSPNIEISEENRNAAIDLISEKLDLSEDKEKMAKSILDKITSKLSDSNNDASPSKEPISTSVDGNQEQVDHIQRQDEPTTIDTLNED